MDSYLLDDHYDLVTPDGKITGLKPIDLTTAIATVTIEHISPGFLGFKIDPHLVFFNMKSTLAQLGVNGTGTEYHLDPKNLQATVTVELKAIDPIGAQMLHYLTIGAYIGKLFAADDRRRVRDPHYLTRMFGRSDRFGDALLSLGGKHGSKELLIKKIDNRAVAFLPLKEGTYYHESAISGFLPIVGKALRHPKSPLRSLLEMNRIHLENAPRIVKKDHLLLVKTLPLHVRTVFARVAQELLPKGYFHMTASVLEPSTKASGDIYELYGDSTTEIQEIPLEFYTLEPHREYVFFTDRDQLHSSLEDPKAIFNVFKTAPKNPDLRTAVFVVKGEQLLKLTEKDWIAREHIPNDCPGLIHPTRQALTVDRYIQRQPEYPFLKSIEKGLITSEGVLFIRHFPSPLMKRMFLSHTIQQFCKRIYFQFPSQCHGDYFSHEDRSFLLDLAKFAVPVYWVDQTTNCILKYVPRPEKDVGMFVPEHLVDTFSRSTFFGIYGSTLIGGNFDEELTKLLQGILEMRKETNHPLLHQDTPLALVTGGGPGAMEVGNRIAKNLGILSCANIVNFNEKTPIGYIEQEQNRYIEAKMTYRLDRLVERQAEFLLDFPILLTGGIGTDFEHALEEIRRKIGASPLTPILLFGTEEYWKDKITSRFQCNLKAGTIAGSEWISNCFYCIQNAGQGLKIYRDYFAGTLPIGPNGPVFQEGFTIIN